MYVIFQFIYLVSWTRIGNINDYLELEDKVLHMLDQA